MEIARLSPYLQAQLAANQLSHAYLFCGDGAPEQAMAFSAVLLCPAAESGAPCGVCPSCLRFAAGTHSDFHLVEPEGTGHKIEAMRHLHSLAALSSIESAIKIFVIRDADDMGEPAANSLLKLLEEPPAGAVFVLTSKSADTLLPTIVSRCQCYSFGQLESQSSDLPEVAQVMAEAERFLSDLPEMTVTQVLLLAKDREKDPVAQEAFFTALLKLLHGAATGRIVLPMGRDKALHSAIMVENAIDYLRKRIRQQLLTDVVYLRLWQNSQGGY